jgi:hypothetical protein
MCHSRSGHTKRDKFMGGVGQKTRNTSTKNGVGIVLDKSLKDGVVDIKRQGDRIILVKLLVGDLVFNVISAYAPQIGLNESVKMQF